MWTSQIWLGVEAVLAAFLCVSVWRRWQLDAARRRAQAQRCWDWSGRPHATAVILPKIERLRKASLKGAPLPVRAISAHRRLVAAARQFILQMAYFQQSGTQSPDQANHEAHKHMA